MTPKVQLTIVSGGSYQQRENRIASVLDGITQTKNVAIILEGLPIGESSLESLTESSPLLRIERIAPGCVCCIGQLALRVTLNRLLRQHPERLFLAISDAAHMDALTALLQAPPYDRWIALGESIK
jgi:G3E family GTPase